MSDLQSAQALKAVNNLSAVGAVCALSFTVSMAAMLVGVAFMSLFERKLMGTVQSRVGPSKVSFMWGFTQPISDAIKLASKQNPTPSSSESLIYTGGPVLMCITYLAAWCIPFPSVCGYSKGLLILLALLSCSALWQALSGWVTHSSYSELGSVRAIAQSVSFEIIMSMSVMNFLLVGCSSMPSFENFFMNHFSIGTALIVSTAFLMFALLAESGRSPFDLPEGESELVGGYLVDYGGSLYKLIFLAENLACLLIAGVVSMCCFQSVSWALSLSLLVIILFLRTCMPRFGFRTMMPTVWLAIMPSLISFMALSVSIA